MNSRINPSYLHSFFIPFPFENFSKMLPEVFTGLIEDSYRFFLVAINKNYRCKLQP